jgi:hypothetical protein
VPGAAWEEEELSDALSKAWEEEEEELSHASPTNHSLMVIF